MRPHLALGFCALLCFGAAGALGTDQSANLAAPSLAPIDPQQVQDQQDMSWADYKPIPGHNWALPSLEAPRKLRVALVAIDFPDQPFVITQPKQSDMFGNPQIDPIARADVPRFYADFFNTPGPLNHGQTINGFWMEQSRGKVGIPPLDVYGPYRMPKNLFQYGLNEWGQGGGCPTGFACDGRMEPDADALWMAGAGKDVKSKYDIVLRIYAGYDETSVWQEFGEMKFASRDDIPDTWGNPDKTKPRWVATRYVPWTAWKAGQMQWGLSSVRQGESSGTITHEIAHFAFRTGDNNNNPYADTLSPRRLGTMGCDGSRLFQRARRAASQMGGAAGGGGRDAGRVHVAQSPALRVRAPGSDPEAQSQRAGRFRPRRRAHRRACGRSRCRRPGGHRRHSRWRCAAGSHAGVRHEGRPALRR